ncbi:MAG: putative Thioredoxin domain [Streblomastix strix]|uniref:Putative Thioredoxin domain n=1 Tax=Streblomastix strix TaxID=222440 RepID=A0A5J4WLV0_9EUKA|nr:MAG: putative Thioredoxin domain [Streblomastix strix]
MADIGQVLLQAAEVIESEVDKRLEELNEVDDFEALRAQRLAQLKKKQENRMKWLHEGHGKINEVVEEKDFFNETRGVERCIVHFHRPQSKYSDLLGQHLQKLAELHIETKFVRINAEKSPFLCTRLGVTIIPTLSLIEKGKVAGKIEGLEAFGGEKLTTHSVEKVFATFKMVDDIQTEGPGEDELD